MNYDNIAVLIPAYKPDRRLNQLVNDLLAANFKRVVVVDDGGGEAFAPIFADLAGKATVLGGLILIAIGVEILLKSLLG